MRIQDQSGQGKHDNEVLTSTLEASFEVVATVHPTIRKSRTHIFLHQEAPIADNQCMHLFLQPIVTLEQCLLFRVNKLN